jgi:succinate dehydrogenase/fumarate reductase flavoprotein subunit
VAARQGTEGARSGWDREVDLVVIGAGPAGMTAALVAKLEGLDVLLCEKSDLVGGTGSTSAGTLWIPGNSISTAAGLSDSAAEAGKYLDGLIPSDRARVSRAAYLANADRAIRYLMSRSEVQFDPAGKHPDYLSDRPGAAISGRAIVARPFDGRLLGSDFRHVRPPIPEFLVFGGMMVGKPDIAQLVNRFKRPGSFIYSARLLLRFLSDRLRYERGTRLVMGNALVARLYHSLLGQRVPIEFNASLLELVLEGDAVVGAVFGQGSRLLRVRARRGVVLATGGIGHDEVLRRRLFPEPARPYSLANADTAGAGLMAAESVGARIDGEGDRAVAFWTPVSLVPRPDGSHGLFPHLVLDRAKPGLLAVAPSGRRFVNEAASYHDFVLAMLNSNELAPGQPAYLVCSAAFVRKYGLGIIYPGTRSLSRFMRNGYVTVAPTVGELASRLGMDARHLEETVCRHDEFARTGVDEDFHKGATEHNRFGGDPTHGPNPCIGPLGEGPYVALKVWPAEIASSAGIAADESGRVLDRSGRPVPGLYACGNDRASIMEGTYPGPGTTLGPAMVFAYLIAMRARGEGRAAA